MYRLCPFTNATQDEGTNPSAVLLGQGGTLNFADPNTPKVNTAIYLYLIVKLIFNIF